MTYLTSRHYSSWLKLSSRIGRQSELCGRSRFGNTMAALDQKLDSELSDFEQDTEAFGLDIPKFCLIQANSSS